MVVCGGRRKRWKVVVLFTDHNESLNGRYRWIEETTVVIPVVVALNMVGGRSVEICHHGERERESWGEREREWLLLKEGVVVVIIVRDCHGEKRELPH